MRGKKAEVDFDLILELNKQGKTTSEIADILNISKRTLSGLILRNNIPIQKRLYKHYINEDFFSDINSEIKAYYIGYIIADGCITKELRKNGNYSYRLILECKSDDDIIIKTLAKELNVENSIYNRHRTISIICGKDTKVNPSTTLKISSFKIVNDLMRVGISFRKSSNAELIIDESIIAGKYFFDFVRGLIDGDGSITSDLGGFIIYGNNVKLFQQIELRLKKELFLVNTNIVKKSCYVFSVNNGSGIEQSYIDKISSKIWSKGCFCLPRKIPKKLN